MLGRGWNPGSVILEAAGKLGREGNPQGWQDVGRGSTCYKVLNTSDPRPAGTLRGVGGAELSAHLFVLVFIEHSWGTASHPAGSWQVLGTEKQMRQLLLQRSQYTNCLQCPVWWESEKKPLTPLKNESEWYCQG